MQEDGAIGILDSEVVDEPEDRSASRMDTFVRVLCATGLPENLANDVRVEHTYFIDEKPYKVPAVPGHHVNPEFNYSQASMQGPEPSRFP